MKRKRNLNTSKSTCRGSVLIPVTILVMIFFIVSLHFFIGTKGGIKLTNEERKRRVVYKCAEDAVAIVAKNLRIMLTKYWDDTYPANTPNFRGGSIPVQIVLPNNPWDPAAKKSDALKRDFIKKECIQNQHTSLSSIEKEKACRYLADVYELSYGFDMIDGCKSQIAYVDEDHDEAGNIINRIVINTETKDGAASQTVEATISRECLSDFKYLIWSDHELTFTPDRHVDKVNYEFNGNVRSRKWLTVGVNSATGSKIDFGPAKIGPDDFAVTGGPIMQAFKLETDNGNYWSEHWDTYTANGDIKLHKKSFTRNEYLLLKDYPIEPGFPPPIEECEEEFGNIFGGGTSPLQNPTGKGRCWHNDVGNDPMMKGIGYYEAVIDTDHEDFDSKVKLGGTQETPSWLKEISDAELEPNILIEYPDFINDTEKQKEFKNAYKADLRILIDGAGRPTTVDENGEIISNDPMSIENLIDRGYVSIVENSFYHPLAGRLVDEIRINMEAFINNPVHKRINHIYVGSIKPSHGEIQFPAPGLPADKSIAGYAPICLDEEGSFECTSSPSRLPGSIDMVVIKNGRDFNGHDMKISTNNILAVEGDFNYVEGEPTASVEVDCDTIQFLSNGFNREGWDPVNVTGPKPSPRRGETNYFLALQTGMILPEIEDHGLEHTLNVHGSILQFWDPQLFPPQNNGVKVDHWRVRAFTNPSYRTPAKWVFNYSPYFIVNPPPDPIGDSGYLSDIISLVKRSPENLENPAYTIIN